MIIDSNENLQSKTYFFSEVSKHTSEKKGYWMVVENQVYDITTFMSRHPGGNVILKMHAGLDASSEFKRVGHDVDPIALKMLKRYRIGDFICPEFTDRAEQALYSKWVYSLSLCTEMLNAFSLDITMLSKDLIPTKEAKDTLSQLNIEMMVELLARYKLEYLLPLIKKIIDCLSDDTIKKEVQLIEEKFQNEFQLSDTSITPLLNHKVVFQELSRNQLFLYELKDVLVEMNGLWEQHFYNNTFSFFQQRSQIEQKLVELLRPNKTKEKAITSLHN